MTIDAREGRISDADRGISDVNTRSCTSSNAFDTSSERSDNENAQSDAATNITSRENYEPVMGNAMEVDTHGMTSILVDIRNEVRHMNRKFDRLEKSVDSIMKDNKKFKAQNRELKEQVEDLSVALEKLDKKSAEIEQKNERIEAQSRRQNLKFHGIPESNKESWDESEKKVRDYISEELEINGTQIKIERAHRLRSRKNPKPIIVKFSFFIVL
ncbi:MAG: hypothetical protein AB2693_02655 [Candidatus Thiodiazotropha sp.]